MDYNEIQNKIEREIERKYPGYHGPRHGEWTPGNTSVSDPVLKFRTQVELRQDDELTVYWLVGKEGNFHVGDEITLEGRGVWIAVSVWTTMREDLISVPHRTIRWMSLNRVNREEPEPLIQAKSASN